MVASSDVESTRLEGGGEICVTQLKLHTHARTHAHTHTHTHTPPAHTLSIYVDYNRLCKLMNKEVSVEQSATVNVAYQGYKEMRR